MAVASAAHEVLQSTIHFLPSADPPHRPATSACAVDRANMVELAIAGNPGFICDRRELFRHGKSYSVDTLRLLRKELGEQAPIVWLIGLDSFLGLTSWHHWQELFSLCHFVVAPRPDHYLQQIDAKLQVAIVGRWTESVRELESQPAGGLFLLPMKQRDDSATRIRLNFEQGRPDYHHLPASVAEYIKIHQLYTSGV